MAIDTVPEVNLFSMNTLKSELDHLLRVSSLTKNLKVVE